MKPISPSATVLVIEDEPQLRLVYTRLLSYEGYAVLSAANCHEGLLAAGPLVDVILCDVRLPDGSGLDMLPKLRVAAPNAQIIMLTAYGTIADGVEAMRRGAFDYLTKGDADSQLLVRLHQAVAHAKAMFASKGKASNAAAAPVLIGKAPNYKAAILMAEAIAPTNAAILLTGETGTGKEVFAMHIHGNSQRSGKPIVAINCAALPKETLESELFGHAKGAFTGAIADKKGLVEEAFGGTLFLDEIGEMPLDLQPKLLRFLENGAYFRMGDTKVRQADVRLISATNRDLKAEVAQGAFRADLYYRLAVLELRLPSLSERGAADIEELATHFLAHFNTKNGHLQPSLTAEQKARLIQSPWPGNVRELKNAMERASILGLEAALPPMHLVANTAVAHTMAESGNGFNLAHAERQIIEKALAFTRGNKTQAAKVLGIGLTTLYRKMEEYDLK